MIPSQPAYDFGMATIHISEAEATRDFVSLLDKGSRTDVSDLLIGIAAKEIGSES